MALGESEIPGLYVSAAMDMLLFSSEIIFLIIDADGNDRTVCSSLLCP